MKNTMLLIALSTAVSAQAITPLEQVEAQARTRANAVKKTGDVTLGEYNDLLAYQASYLNKQLAPYFDEDGIYELPGDLSPVTAVFDFDALTKARQKIRDNYNVIANLANTQKLNNKEFQLLCREVLNGYSTLDTILDRIQIDLRNKFQLDANGALPTKKTPPVIAPKPIVVR